MKTKPSGMIHLAIIAALVCTLCDKVHVISGTLSYPNPVFDGQPWWNLPGFFVAFLVMGLVYLNLAKSLPSSITRAFSTSKGAFGQLIESFLLFAFIYMLSGFGNAWPLLLNVLFYSTFLLRFMASPDKSFMIIVSLILGVGGVVGEGVLSALDLVHYSKPVIFYVPAWLAGLYMHGAFTLRECMRFFVYLEDR